MTERIDPGHGFPLGATVVRGGVNFSVFSRSASAVELLLFERPEDGRAAASFRLDPAANRTYHYWHACIPGLRSGQLYGYRVHGPSDPTRGLRFDPGKVLLDPYGKAVAVPHAYSRDAASREGDNAATAMKSVVVDPGAYDWGGDKPPRRPFSQTIIYEMHVRGFTRHKSSGIPSERRGTYAGLIEKIPYLQDLGITAVELLPVFHFDPQDAPPGRTNFWGYAPVSFFAPHPDYSSRRDPLGAVDEFRDMVKALHRAGLEVILDVVFNHTAEGDHRGPTLCFRGFENEVYYILEADRSRYANYSGTGNTFNGNHPVVRRLIRDSLRYWVQEMHVDGFRFDLASILSRDESGHPLADPPVLWDIETDPVLAGTKLIAEAWDAAGLYQVGSFVGDAWKEWNGKFRDDVRSFFRGDEGTVGAFASRLLGSPDIYGHKEREASQSIHFVTCHDGFTLNDLVSYDRKHNEANGEGNRDGSDDNRSWNCGFEGPTHDRAVEDLRERQIRNFLVTNLIALGVPMVLMGDEVRRTQKGNNNAFCQDSELGWLDWALLDRHPGVHRFLKTLARRRAHRDDDAERRRLTLNDVLRQGRVEWHGVQLGRPDWSPRSHAIALTVAVGKSRLLVHGIFNAYWERLDFELPPLPEGRWRRWVDTSLPSPDDVTELDDAPAVEGASYRAAARSVVLLFAGRGGPGERPGPEASR